MTPKQERLTPQPANQVIFVSTKDNQKFDTQLIRVYDAFYESPGTMKEVDRRIGIMRESICRYCAKLRKQDKLYPIRKRLCNVTNHLAIEWTTNSALVPPRPIQLDLFTPITETLEAKLPQSIQNVKPFNLIEWITEEGAWYELNQNGNLLKIQPFQWDGRRSSAWPKVFEGLLEECDEVVDNLIKTGRPW